MKTQLQELIGLIDHIFDGLKHELITEKQANEQVIREIDELIEKEEKLLEIWLKDNKSLLSIRAIENEIKCPNTTLQKVVQERQKLPEKWKEPLRLIRERLSK